MTREMLDQYLDGMLDNAARAALERDLKSDPSAAGLLSTMKTERSARAAVLASYAPSPADARTFAAHIMATCREEEFAPVGRIDHFVWTRRIAGVAAALLVAIGSYTLGQKTVQPSLVEVPVEKTVYNVISSDSRAEPMMFESVEARDNWLREQESPAYGLVTVDYKTPGRI